MTPNVKVTSSTSPGETLVSQKKRWRTSVEGGGDLVRTPAATGAYS